jgi:formyltetrahydrofolate-dependent phosphoribosylglycinamide formyltransferase
LKKLQLGVFASGRGSNFASILKAVDEGRLAAEVRALISNNPDAGALEIAKSRSIPAETVSSGDFASREKFVEHLQDILRRHGVDFIALAGYMKKIPREVVALYPNRICNIHPALLPSFGGKGMYGHHVHQAVLAHGCKVSGVTIHLVDEKYDCGPIVLQRCVPVQDDDTEDTLAGRVLQLEHALYPEALQLFAEGKVRVEGRRVFLR